MKTNTTPAHRAALFLITLRQTLVEMPARDRAALERAIAAARLDAPADLALVEIHALVSAASGRREAAH